MSATLRISLIVISLLFVGLVFYTVNRKKLQMGDSLLWLLLSFLLILLAFFPQIGIWLSRLVGIETPANFIYLVGIVALLALVFHLTVQHSSLKLQVRSVIQELSIENYLREKAEREQADDSTDTGA